MNNNNNHDNTVDIINNNSFRQQQLATQNAIQNQTTAGVQKILDKMCDQETQRLRTELAEARVIANNTQQTADIVNAIRPFPQSAYIVSSPYTSIYPPTTTAAASGS